MNLGIDMGRRHGVSRGERRFDGIRVDRDLGLIGMRGVVNGDTLRHVEPLQLTRLLKHGLPAAPRIAATNAELRRDCNSQVRPPDRLFGKTPPSCKGATTTAPHARKSLGEGKSGSVRV